MCGRIFEILMIVGVVSAQYGNEQIFPRVQPVSTEDPSSLKDINQWNIVQQIGQQPSAAPGFVWIQVPVSNVQQQAGGGNNVQVQEVGVGETFQSVGQGIPPSFVSIGGGSAPVQGPAAVAPSEGTLNGKCLQPRGQFPSTACNKFVNCWDGVATEQKCPGGLLFKSDKGYCDFADRVNCGGRPVVEGIVGPPSPPTSISGDVTASWTSPPAPSAGQSSSGAATSGEAPTTLSSAIFPTAATLPPVITDPELKKRCLKPRGQFPSKACNKFVNCWDDNVIEQECPEGLLFSARGYCDYATNVDCGDKSSPKNTTPDVTECPLETGTFRDKNDCGSYYTCLRNKIVIRHECPIGFKFSDHIGVCDYEDRVDCTKEPFIYQRKVNTESISEYEVDGGNTQCPVEFGTYRDKTNCSSYYTCVSYKIVAKRVCPSGFLFNDDIGVCDYSDRVDCTKTPKVFHRTNNFIPQLPAAYMDKIKSCTPGVVLRLDAQCSMACLCRDGVAEVVQCPAGTAYDSATDKCVALHLARC